MGQLFVPTNEKCPLAGGPMMYTLPIFFIYVTGR